jgi:hypothetical protein
MKCPKMTNLTEGTSNTGQRKLSSKQHTTSIISPGRFHVVIVPLLATHLVVALQYFRPAGTAISVGRLTLLTSGDGLHSY